MRITLGRKAYKIRRVNTGGPGGQHQNTTENGIVITLLPDVAAELGIPVVSAAASLRSQHRSKAQAVKLFAARIVTELRKTQARGRYSAGTDRVRNYHQPDDRVTDATGGKWSYRKTVGDGDLGPCIDGRRDALLAAAD